MKLHLRSVITRLVAVSVIGLASGLLGGAVVFAQSSQPSLRIIDGPPRRDYAELAKWLSMDVRIDRTKIDAELIVKAKIADVETGGIRG